MRFFIARTKPCNGALYLSSYKPEMFSIGEGVVDWAFKKAPLKSKLDNIDGLYETYGITKLPEPGEMMEVQVNSGDSEAEKHLKEVFEEN